MSIFDGDGRKYVDPVNAPVGTQPLRVSKKNAQRYCRWFEEAGLVSSSHSARGSTVWVTVTYCIERGYEYEVEPLHVAGKVAGWQVKGKVK